jgi:predicted methyltransferase
VLGALHAGRDFESIVRHRRRSLESSGTIDALFEAGCVAVEHGQTVLTDRGHEAAHICEDAREALDRRIADTIGTDGFETMRKGLLSLIDWKEAHE